MKTVKRIACLSMIFVFIFSFGNLSAADSPLNVTPLVKVTYGEKAKTLELRLANLMEKKTMIKIKDSRNRTVYQECFRKKNGFSASIDMSVLKEGDYNMTITCGEAFVLHPIYISDVGLELIALNFIGDPHYEAEFADISPE